MKPVKLVILLMVLGAISFILYVANVQNQDIIVEETGPMVQVRTHVAT